MRQDLWAAPHPPQAASGFRKGTWRVVRREFVYSDVVVLLAFVSKPSTVVESTETKATHSTSDLPGLMIGGLSIDLHAKHEGDSVKHASVAEMLTSES
jgi:hypothetical protein